MGEGVGGGEYLDLLSPFPQSSPTMGRGGYFFSHFKLQWVELDHFDLVIGYYLEFGIWVLEF